MATKCTSHRIKIISLTRIKRNLYSFRTFLKCTKLFKSTALPGCRRPPRNTFLAMNDWEHIQCCCWSPARTLERLLARSPARCFFARSWLLAHSLVRLFPQTVANLRNAGIWGARTLVRPVTNILNIFRPASPAPFLQVFSFWGCHIFYFHPTRWS